MKQQEQLGSSTVDVTTLFDFCFPENGLVAFRMGKPLASNSFIQWLGEEKYQELADFCLRYISNLKLPKKRGTFVEFRNGMINVSPIGRNASVEERNEYEVYVQNCPKSACGRRDTNEIPAMISSTTIARTLSRP